MQRFAAVVGILAIIGGAVWYHGKTCVDPTHRPSQKGKSPGGFEVTAADLKSAHEPLGRALASFIWEYLPSRSRSFGPVEMTFAAAGSATAVEMENQGCAGETNTKTGEIHLDPEVSTELARFWTYRRHVSTVTLEMAKAITVALHEHIHNVRTGAPVRHSWLEEGMTHDIATMLVKPFVERHAPSAKLAAGWERSVGMTMLDLDQETGDYSIVHAGGALGPSPAAVIGYTLAADLGRSEEDHEAYVRRALALKADLAVTRWPSRLAREVASCRNRKLFERALSHHQPEPAKIQWAFQSGCLRTKPKIELIGAEFCPACRDAKKHLDTARAAYQYIDLETHPSALDEVVLADGSHPTRIPVLVINGEAEIGYTPHKFDRRLHAQTIPSFTRYVVFEREGDTDTLIPRVRVDAHADGDCASESKPTLWRDVKIGKPYPFQLRMDQHLGIQMFGKNERVKVACDHETLTCTVTITGHSAA